MKYLKINRILYLFIFSLVITGCQDDNKDVEINNPSKNLPTLLDFHKMISRQTDGKIVIQSTIGLNSQNELRNNYLNGFFEVEKTKQGQVERPNITVGGIELQPPASRNLHNSVSRKIESLYGTTTTINISESLLNNRTSSSSFELYVPKLLTIDNSLKTLSVGNEISWNKDEVNKNGVQIKIDYKAQTQIIQKVAEKYPKNFVKGFVIPDTGKIKITSEMLKGFPNSADILITVARGNIDFLTTENDKIYTVGAITAVTTRSRISK